MAATTPRQMDEPSERKRCRQEIAVARSSGWECATVRIESVTKGWDVSGFGGKLMMIKIFLPKGREWRDRG